jgi:hypothetical protein
MAHRESVGGATRRVALLALCRKGLLLLTVKQGRAAVLIPADNRHRDGPSRGEGVRRLLDWLADGAPSRCAWVGPQSRVRIGVRPVASTTLGKVPVRVVAAFAIGHAAENGPFGPWGARRYRGQDECRRGGHLHS